MLLGFYFQQKPQARSEKREARREQAKVELLVPKASFDISIYRTNTAHLAQIMHIKLPNTWMLGSRLTHLNCCHSEALSTTSADYPAAPSDSNMLIFTVSALITFPAEYTTLTDTSSSTDSLGNRHSYAPSSLPALLLFKQGAMANSIPRLGASRN